MNGEFLRGEVYWVCLDDSIGSEEKTGRPGVIVSSDGLNAKEESVTIAFITKQGFATANRPSISGAAWAMGRARVLCDQLRTVDKSRLHKYMFTCDDSEMVRITGALACTLCIPNTPNKKDVVPQKLEGNDDVVASMRCEIDMWRRMYEKVMDQLVEIKVAADMANRVEPKKEPVEVKSALVEPDSGFEEAEPEEPKKAKTVWDGVKVNVNTVATGTELKNRTGMSSRSAMEIVKTRKIVGKYEKLDDLLALEHFGEISMKRYGHMLTVDDSEPVVEGETEKKPSRVNVNRDNAYKLMEAGFSKTVANRIVHHQKNCTPFRDIDELLEIDGITRGDLRKLREKLEV